MVRLTRWRDRTPVRNYLSTRPTTPILLVLPQPTDVLESAGDSPKVGGNRTKLAPSKAIPMPPRWSARMVLCRRPRGRDQPPTPSWVCLLFPRSEREIRPVANAGIDCTGGPPLHSHFPTVGFRGGFQVVAVEQPGLYRGVGTRESIPRISTLAGEVHAASRVTCA